MARLELPEKEEHLVMALETELQASERESFQTLTSHRIIDGYLKGSRKFNVLNRNAGKVAVGQEVLRGDVIYRHEDIVRRYLVEVGRWLRSDIKPVIRRAGDSLDDMRRAAIAQAVLDARISHMNLSTLRTRTVVPFVKYGIVGLAYYDSGDEMMPDQIDVVPSRQLRFLPAYVEGLENLVGIARHRWMPYDWVKERVKKRYDVDLDQHDIESDLGGHRVAWGTFPPGSTLDSVHGSPASSALADGIANRRDPTVRGYNYGFVEGPSQTINMDSFDEDNDINKEGRYYVPMEEIYPYTDDHTYAARFILKIGHKVIHQEDYESVGKKKVCPLQAARYTDVGSSFSRGFVAPLIPQNDLLEKVVGSVGRNLRELDIFGTLMVPDYMNIDVQKWNQPGPRPRVDTFSVNPLAPSALQPLTLQPANPGLLPVHFGSFLSNQLDMMAGQGPFFQGQAAGRDIGAAGHGFLFNTSNIGLGLQSHNLADAFANIYACILQSAKESLSKKDTVKIATVTDALAGVVFDPRTGEATLADNPLPHPWEVKIDVKDRTPRDPDIRKQELLGNFQAGLLGQSPEESYLRYWITVWEENLDAPGGPKDVYETWRKAIWQIILLFNDGVTPGGMQFGEHEQNPKIQLQVLQQFMNKIEFSLSSDEVQQEFVFWKEALERMIAPGMTRGLPYPEDALAMAEQTGQIGGGGGGGMQPPGPQGGAGGVGGGGMDMSTLLGSAP